MLRHLVLILASFALCHFLPLSAFAEIESIEMQVEGMNCPFCVHGVDKSLKRVESVEYVSANLKTATVNIELKSGSEMDVGRLLKAVEDTGFTPGEIRIKARGELTVLKLEGMERPALRVSGSEQVFILTVPSGNGKEEFVGGEKLHNMREAAQYGDRKISITGYVITNQKGLPPYLRVESFEVS